MVGRVGDTPRSDDLLAELAAARSDLAKVDHATRLVRAQSRLEAILQAVRLEGRSADPRRIEALAGEAMRIVQTLEGGIAARYPAEVEQARQVALRIREMTPPPADGSVKIEV